MKPEFVHRSTCRLCESDELEMVVPFVPTPVADAYVPKTSLSAKQSTFPLDMYFCKRCHHVQLLDVVDPEILFGGYTYLSSSSAGLVKHFGEYADGVMRRFNPPPGSLVVEIGSNDGVLLRFFKEKGLKVLGVDPAKEIARKATEAGIETLPEFFTPKSAEQIRQRHGLAQIISANNVFAHADDMIGMVKNIGSLLRPDGVFVFEASYVVDVVDKMLLGSIFHEHLCYHSVEALSSFFDRFGMELIDVERATIQGGSLIGYAQKKGGPHPRSAVVDQLIAEERRRGFDRPEVYREFSKRINRLRDEVRALLQGFKSKGQRIAGFGAARGGTTLVYHFGLGDFLEYIVDDNPEKHGLYSPGLHVPVLPTSAMYEKDANYLFLLAWVHAKPILEKHKALLEKGGHFVIAHPKLEVV